MSVMRHGNMFGGHFLKKIKTTENYWPLLLKWLQEVDPTHGSWQYVWQTLFERDTSSDMLRDFALKWLQPIDPNHHSWARVWEAITYEKEISKDTAGCRFKVVAGSQTE